ncbi:MAG: GAF domain-containing protein [Balneolales bacterium]
MSSGTTQEATLRQHSPLEKREENAQRKFKQILHDLTVLLRHSTEVDTVILYWINKDREIFVLETKTTSSKHTMFEDRVAFNNLYLNDFKEIKDPVQLEVGRHIMADELTHYFKKVPIQYVNLLPFVNNDETIAITVMESQRSTFSHEQEEAMSSYMNALSNLLGTYLELNDLADNQNQWIEYEFKLKSLFDRLDGIALLDHTINEIQEIIGKGGVSLLCRGMNDWHNVLNSTKGINQPYLGQKVEENTITWDALSRGEPVYSIHFNANPKRMSPREPLSRGASLAIPILVDDRRQAVILINAENPLVFSEANKHKMINLSRIASLRLASKAKADTYLGDFVANEFSAYKSELFEKAVEAELRRCKFSADTKTWIGFVTLTNLTTLRTKLRLEELQTMQQLLIEGLNPQNFGINGYLASHSDYVYAFIMQAPNDEPITEWKQCIDQEFSQPVELSRNQKVKIDFVLGFISLNEQIENSYQAIREAKSALSAAMK